MHLDEGIVERRVHVRQYLRIGLILIMPSFDDNNPCKGTMCEKKKTKLLQMDMISTSS
jgi:hypothetical protein